MLTLQVLDSDSELNTLIRRDQAQFVGGEDLTITLRLIQSEKDLRYIPSASASFEIELLKSDGTFITKSGTDITTKFPDDRSVLEFQVSASESVDLISQDLIMKITESGSTKFAILRRGLLRIALGDC